MEGASLILLACCLALAQGQVLNVNFTAPAEDVPGNSALFTCQYTLTPPATLDFISIQKLIGGIYEDQVIYNESDQLLYGAEADRFDAVSTDGLFELTILSSLEADTGEYRCNVEDSAGKVGEDTATFTVTNVDACEEEPCQNGGTCTDGVDTFTCQCLSCYNDATCETLGTKLCDANPCKNGATCTNQCDAFSCACAFNFGGDTCSSACNGIVNITGAITAIAGDSVTFTCETADTFNAANGDKVYWSQDPSGTPPRLSSNSAYTFVAAKDKEGALYCFVDQASCISRDSTTLTVTFELSPNVTSYENVTVKEREELTLTCEATGKPTPMLIWMYLPPPPARANPPNMGGMDENMTTPEPSTIAPTQPPQPVQLGNATANSSTYVIARANMQDAGRYVCVADQAGGIRTEIKAVTVQVVEGESGGLEGWEIALIVIGCILFVAIIVAVVFLILWKTGKAGAICPGGKVDAAEKGKKKESSSPYENSSPRPLPDAPTGRAGTLPPLNMEEEKEKVKKKKKKPKKKKVESDQENEDSGHDDNF